MNRTGEKLNSVMYAVFLLLLLLGVAMLVYSGVRGNLAGTIAGLSMFVAGFFGLARRQVEDIRRRLEAIETSIGVQGKRGA